MVMAKIGTVDPITRKRSMTDSTAIAWAGSIDGMGAPIVGALVGFCGVFGDFMWIEWEFL